MDTPENQNAPLSNKIITPDTIRTVQELLKDHGFEEALRKTSVACIMKGVEADEFTYCVVASFLTFILRQSMQSHNDVMMKLGALQQNTKAIDDVLRACAHELFKELQQEARAVENVAAKVDVRKH